MLPPYTYLINGFFNATISPLDRGFAYGDGVFRTMKMVDGVIEAWPLHYQKLVLDCSQIGIVAPSAELLMQEIAQLFKPELKVVVIKVIITRGEGARGYAPPAITIPTRVVMQLNMPIHPETNTMGVHLWRCNTRLAHQPLLAGVKHLNRLESVLARAEWTDAHFSDGLMFDREDNVIECTSANLFARFGDTLITPDLSQCGVAGVTRGRILQFGGALKLSINTQTLNFTQLKQADEVIICNSLYGACPVLSCDNAAWKNAGLAQTINELLQ